MQANRRAGVLIPLLCAFAILGASPASSATRDPERCSAELSEGLPARSPEAAAGQGFAQSVMALDGPLRDQAVAAAVEGGNLPTFLRQLRPVVFGGEGGAPRVVVCVAPDYLAVGSETDFLRVPLGLEAALAVATRHGFILPTRKMVDAIYRQSDLRLAPQPQPPGPQMASTAYFARHNATIERQRKMQAAPLGALVAGVKKDLVLTPRLRSKAGRVAIYGWHRENGKAIQPLSTVHGATYADYSHGIRLVSAVVTVEGERRSIYDVLADPALAPLLSDEGPIPGLEALVVSLGGAPEAPATSRQRAARADAPRLTPVALD